MICYDLHDLNTNALFSSWCHIFDDLCTTRTYCWGLVDIHKKLQALVVLALGLLEYVAGVTLMYICSVYI